MAKSNKEQNQCTKCGVELDESNARHANAQFCIYCEQEQYEQLREGNGTSLALYLACSRFDVPLHPLILPNDFEEETDKWIRYIELLEENDKFSVGDRLATFQDGETRLLRIFGKNFTETDFAKYVKHETERIESLEGTQQQREVWGEDELWANFPLTTKIYDKLDRLYSQRIAEYRGQNLSEQIKSTLRRVCKLMAAQDFLQSRGDAVAFDKIQKSIDSILASEQLRKKDEKPVENFRIDSQLVALERAGFVEDGKFLPFDKMRQAILSFTRRKGKYNHSIDVLDHTIEDIYNTMRANADLFIPSELPESLAPNDEFDEFLESPTEEETDNARYAGLTKVQFTDKGGGD